MDPRDDDEFSPDESEDTEPRIRELRAEMVRLQAQIDQLAAATKTNARPRLPNSALDSTNSKWNSRKSKPDTGKPSGCGSGRDSCTVPP
jgi:hypothetical protein